jgi:cytochrome c-type biogenesis protein CcmH/NrfG
MNRHMIIGIVIGLVVGLFVGYQAGSSGSSAPPAMGAMPAMPPGAAQPMPSAPGPELQARISSLQSIVARDPKNVDAWVQLGNDYFDTHQPQKSIEAYGRALELRPNDPNVLTDQGVMYKDLGQYEKAISNFEKANKADPKHVQSLFNLAVVYAVNLKQNQKAIDAWNKVVQVAPGSPQAEQAKAAIADLKTKAP